MFENMTEKEIYAELEENPDLLLKVRQCHKMLQLFEEMPPEGKAEFIAGLRKMGHTENELGFIELADVFQGIMENKKEPDKTKALPVRQH